MYEYEARHYDAATGRFVTNDPLAEDYSSQTTYAYAANNPIYFIDKKGENPEGCCGELVNKVKAFFSELIGDSQTLAASGGNDSEAAQRLQDKSETLSKLEGGMNATVDFARESVEMLPYGEALSAVAEGEVTGDMQGALTNYGEQQVEDAPYAAAAAVIPGASKKVLKKGAQKLIGPAGDAGAIVTRQVPKSYTMKSAKKGAGTRFSDPKSKGSNSVRVMRGNPNSPNPSQRVDYVKHTKNGKSVDVNGNPAVSNTPAAHIPKKDFNIKN